MISEEQYLQFSPYFAQEDIEKEDERLKFLQLTGRLPQAVKELLTSIETIEKIVNISSTFGLDEFDTEAVSLVVRKLATGEVPIVQGTELIISEAGLPQEKADDLLDSIINEILAPVVGNVQKIQPVRPLKKTTVPVHSLNQTKPETTDSRIVDLRNR